MLFKVRSAERRIEMRYNLSYAAGNKRLLHNKRTLSPFNPLINDNKISAISSMLEIPVNNKRRMTVQ